MHIKLEVFLSIFKIKSKQTKMYLYISIIVQISFIIFLISLLRTEGENVKFNKSKYNFMEKNSLWSQLYLDLFSNSKQQCHIFHILPSNAQLPIQEGSNYVIISIHLTVSKSETSPQSESN